MKYQRKAVVGYEGLYEVDTKGNVFSLPRNGRQEIILKQTKAGRGYFYVGLSDWGKVKRYLVSRIVATAFIPNPEFKPQVNHIDENIINNNVENLEWVTVKENIHHGTGLKRMGDAHGINVKVTYPDGKIREFNSIREASANLFNGSITKLGTGRVLSKKADVFTYEGYKIEIIKLKHQKQQRFRK